MSIRTVYVLLSSFSVVYSAKIFTALEDGRCLSNCSNLLASYNDTDRMLCSYICAKTPNCAIISIDATGVCNLHAAMRRSFYDIMSTSSPGQCNTWALQWVDELQLKIAGSATFTTNGSFTVPENVTLLRVLAVGGGGGSGPGNGPGGGSGYVATGEVQVTQNQTYNVIVGSGGNGDVAGGLRRELQSAGGLSSFGGLVVAYGGGISNSGNGGSGGSGGGTGTYNWFNARSGSGGRDGNRGTIGISSSSFVGGSGQGCSFTAWFSQFKLSNISSGAGALGKQGSEPYRYGGGGGGGVLLNNTGPTSGGSICLESNITCGPVGASGYGAGGSAGVYNGSTYSRGGSGADGLVYLEYYS